MHIECEAWEFVSQRPAQRRSFTINEALCFSIHSLFLFFSLRASALRSASWCDETIGKRIARRGTIELSLRRCDSIVNTRGEKKSASRQSADGQITSTAGYNAPLFIGRFISRSFFLRGSARGPWKLGVIYVGLHENDAARRQRGRYFVTLAANACAERWRCLWNYRVLHFVE